MLVLRAIVAVFRAVFTTRAGLMVENLALRQQINVLRRRTRRPKLQRQDRVFWLWLAHTWNGWRDTLVLVKPDWLAVFWVPNGTLAKTENPPPGVQSPETLTLQGFEARRPSTPPPHGY
jgi:hypothetical protein